MLPMHHDKSLYLVHGINSTPFPTVHSEFRTFHGHTYKHVSSMIENGARGSKAEGSVHRVYQDIAACQYIRPFRAALSRAKDGGLYPLPLYMLNIIIMICSVFTIALSAILSSSTHSPSELLLIFIFSILLSKLKKIT